MQDIYRERRGQGSDSCIREAKSRDLLCEARTLCDTWIHDGGVENSLFNRACTRQWEHGRGYNIGDSCDTT